MSVRFSSHVHGQGANQDSAHTGMLAECVYGVVYDGHGKSDCIQHLNTLHERDEKGLHSELALTILEDPRPAERVFDYAIHCSGGAVMNMVCVRPTHIDNYNVGDARSWVFTVDEAGHLDLVHESHPHSVSCIRAEERKRLDTLLGGVRFYTTCNRKITLLDDDTFAIEVGGQAYCDFGRRVRLAATQSLGHEGATGCEPDAARIMRTAHSRHLCILVSDGVTQVLTRASIAQLYELHRDALTAEHVVAAAVKQWEKTWRVIDRGNADRVSWTRFARGDWDDVSAVVMHVRGTQQ